MNHQSPSAPLLVRAPERLTGKRHDVLVIGAGINGAGIARDLALRGLKVALVDKGDFAGGTSSASTKLIHGGIRYLEQYRFGLVFESCRERHILQRIAPHLVSPCPFFIPIYRGEPRPPWMVRSGMILYDLLALGRNVNRHRFLSPSEAVEQEPALRPEGLRGVAMYWDCRMDDARLCLENVLAAAAAGAETCNHLEVTGLLGKDRLRGASVLDRETGKELEIEAEVLVNATGPWLDRLCALAGEEEPKLSPTRGTHILVPRVNAGKEALYLTAGRDQRLFFVIPWGELSLIGTTDIPFAADPDSVAPAPEDIDYLLEESARHLACQAPRREEVIAAFAGLRPLLAQQEGSSSSASREHRIFTSASGMISVGGGKYTTYRAVAAEVADRVAERLGRGGSRPATDRMPLPGGEMDDFSSWAGKTTAGLGKHLGLCDRDARTLLQRYGTRIHELLGLLQRDPDLIRPVVEGSSLRAVEVVHSATFEMARTPEDVLRRRTSVALQNGRGLRELHGVCQILAQHLGADEQRQEAWQRDYLDRHTFP